MPNNSPAISHLKDVLKDSSYTDFQRQILISDTLNKVYAIKVIYKTTDALLLTAEDDGDNPGDDYNREDETDDDEIIGYRIDDDATNGPINDQIYPSFEAARSALLKYCDLSDPWSK